MTQNLHHLSPWTCPDSGEHLFRNRTAHLGAWAAAQAPDRFPAETQAFLDQYA
ncbi:hypothetical protein AB0J63_40610 [Streptosporangium canum]|uniref:hypothetical protein n=1 Tax=Streptosporangium canum TaxID=324952 RepID=UPI003445559F